MQKLRTTDNALEGLGAQHNHIFIVFNQGEKSLSAHMQEVGQKSKIGQEVRLIDIPADAGKGHGVFKNLHNYAGSAELSIELKASAHRYYGTAIDAFLNRLVKEDFKETHAALKTTEENLSKLIPDGAHGQVKRVLRRYAQYLDFLIT